MLEVLLISKQLSMNALHANMEITDQFYSNLNDGEVKNRIRSLSKESKAEEDKKEILDLLRQFINLEERT